MPIYNNADVLDKSINSVVNQTLDDLELICVNDGSTDESLEKLLNYSNKFSFIKIINQKNQGSGIARNNGIENANGEYIGFLDADDFLIDENALKRLYDVAKLNDANMVTGNILHDVDNPGEFIPFKHVEYFTEEKIILPEDYGMPWSFYKSIFKKEFLMDNNIYFPDLLRGQDVVFLAEVLSKVDKIYTVDCDVYAYVYYDAINRCNTYEKLHDQLLHYQMVFDYLNELRFKKANLDIKRAFIWFLDNLDQNNLNIAFDIVNNIFRDNQKILKFLNSFFEYKQKSQNQPIITIISRVHNHAKDLWAIYNNILNQTFPDFELICINDCSTDNSLNILKNISNHDPRVIVINNDGYDSVWRKALSMARGNYVLFHNCNYNYSVYMLNDLFENILFNNNPDVVLFKINENLSGFNDLLKYNFDEIFKDKDFNNFTFNYSQIKDYIFNSVFHPWFKLYKKELLDNHNDYNLSNSFNYMVLHIKSLLIANTISFVPIKFNFFEYFQENINCNISDLIKTFDEINTFLINGNYSTEFNDDFIEFKINQIYKYMYYFKSEIYFNISKEIILKLDIIKDIPLELYKKYYCIYNSYSFEEFKLMDNQFKYCKSIEEFNLCKKAYNLKLTKSKLKLENKILKQEINKIK